MSGTRATIPAAEIAVLPPVQIAAEQSTSAGGPSSDSERTRYTGGPGLDAIGGDDVVLRCRCPTFGDVQWFFDVPSGGAGAGEIRRYHEWRGWREESVRPSIAESIVADPDVATAVVPRTILEWYRYWEGSDGD